MGQHEQRHQAILAGFGAVRAPVVQQLRARRQPVFLQERARNGIVSRADSLGELIRRHAAQRRQRSPFTIEKTQLVVRLVLRHKREKEPAVDRENFPGRPEQRGQARYEISRQKNRHRAAGAPVFPHGRNHRAPA